MYICSCNAIRESDLARVADCVSGDAEACYAALGKRPQCRTCLDEADAFIEALRAGAFAKAA